jgi:hypothetical protein
MTFIARISLLAFLSIASAFAQLNSIGYTTLSAAITSTQSCFAVASATGISAPTATAVGTTLYIVDTGQTNGEKVVVNSISSTTVCTDRTRGGGAYAHASGAQVLVGTANWFYSTDPKGRCSTTDVTLPGTYSGPWYNLVTGQEWVCSAITGTWVRNGDYTFYVPPTQCTFAPTTLTVTNTYPQIGASNLFVLKGISNAAAGTMTLTCNIVLPSRVTATRGAVLKDITLFLASSATGSGVVPTSVGTSTLGTITFPAAATTETASTVTPVTIGGTVATTGAGATGFLTAVTTDGSFYTVKHTYSTAVTLSTDLQILQYTFPILQLAASVSTLYTPGLLVHYTAPAI